jgi:hypothetical protein
LSGNGSARQLRAANRQHRTAVRIITLAAAASVLRSRRFHEQVTVGIIVIAHPARRLRPGQPALG